MGNVIPLRRWKLAVLFKGLFPRTRRRSLCLAGLVGLLAHSFSHANAAPPEIPAELSSEYDGIEADYRNILLQPIATWRLGGIHLRYEALLKRAKEPAAQALIQARIERVSRQEELARSAATFETIVQKSRNRDREVNPLHSQRVGCSRSRRGRSRVVAFIRSSERKEGQLPILTYRRGSMLGRSYPSGSGCAEAFGTTSNLEPR